MGLKALFCYYRTCPHPDDLTTGISLLAQSCELKAGNSWDVNVPFRHHAALYCSRNLNMNNFPLVSFDTSENGLTSFSLSEYGIHGGAPPHPLYCFNRITTGLFMCVNADTVECLQNDESTENP